MLLEPRLTAFALYLVVTAWNEKIKFGGRLKREMCGRACRVF